MARHALTIRIFTSAFALLVLVFELSHCQEISLAENMIAHQIVPDVIDVAPTETIEVTYPSGVIVNSGNELKPIEVKDAPSVKWDADPDSYYTLIMTDPDAPSRANPTRGEVRHWYVVNIAGNNVAEGEILFSYIGSGPPKDTGLHRYVFLSFKQSGRLTFDERNETDRINSSTKDFANKYQLGNPVAGNFFQAQYDNGTPHLTTSKIFYVIVMYILCTNIINKF